MCESFITISGNLLEQEHLCCAMTDKKHQSGVTAKKKWLADRIAEGHIFRKLDVNGKVFIEYAPLETAWVPIQGKSYLYIYCLWISGSFKGKGYGKALLESCIQDAKKKGKSGICVLSSKKKKPFLADKRFFLKFGFTVADAINEEYELLALSFSGEMPSFSAAAKTMEIAEKELTIYYSVQCPCVVDCIKQVRTYCGKNNIPLHLFAVDTLEKAKNLPCVFNNWAVFYNGCFKTHHLLNETYLKKYVFAHAKEK